MGFSWVFIPNDHVTVSFRESDFFVSGNNRVACWAVVITHVYLPVVFGVL